MAGRLAVECHYGISPHTPFAVHVLQRTCKSAKVCA